MLSPKASPCPFIRSNHPRLSRTMEVKDIQSSWICQLYHRFIFNTLKSLFHSRHLTHKGTPWHFTDSAVQPLKHLKGFHHSSGPYPLILDTQITVKTDSSDMHSPLSFQLHIDSELHPIAFTLDFFLLQNSTTYIDTKKLLAIFEAFKWCDIPWGSGLPIWHGHRSPNLHTFQWQNLTRWKAWWSNISFQCIVPSSLDVISLTCRQTHYIQSATLIYALPTLYGPCSYTPIPETLHIHFLSSGRHLLCPSWATRANIIAHL